MAFPAGSIIELKCPTKGGPVPNITWFKDGKLFEDSRIKVNKFVWVKVEKVFQLELVWPNWTNHKKVVVHLAGDARSLITEIREPQTYFAKSPIYQNMRNNPSDSFKIFSTKLFLKFLTYDEYQNVLSQTSDVSFEPQTANLELEIRRVSHEMNMW